MFAKGVLVRLALAITNVAAQASEYEYVIIGSGPGGGPLAANLARAGHSVFLIEAGEDHGDSVLQSSPFFADASSEDPTMSWEFFVSHYQDDEQAHRDTKFTWRTPNDTYYVGLDPPDGSEALGILYPRAGTLGGCSNHNAGNMALPPDNDWDAIANLTGDASWSSQTMRGYFERLENNTYITERNSSAAAGHGFKGYFASTRNDLAFLEAQPGLIEHFQAIYAAFNGHPPNSTEEVFELLQHDQNRLASDRYEHNDLFQLPLHYDAEKRRSSSQTYLRNTINELNQDGTQRYPLTISTNTLATRVVFENDAEGGRPRAVGVECLQGQALYRADRRHNGLQTGAPLNVTATREVIVAGGTFNTPQILKLSGVGPRKELEQFDIPVVVDLPAVGTNMQDNYEAGVHVQAARDHPNPFSACTGLAPGDPCLREWKENGTGPYGFGAATAGLLYRSSVSENADADLFYFGAAGVVFDGYFPGFSTATGSPNDSFWSVVKMQSQNRAGTVRLRSGDPQDVPEINFNYFQEGRDHDLQALKEGAQFVLDIYNQTGAPYGPYTVVQPDPELEIEQAIIDQAFSHHATSSCPMGVNETDSCVDSKFRVHGVDGLRIVDASVFPRVPGAFPILPVFMLSEKATDTILQDLRANGTVAVRK